MHPACELCRGACCESIVLALPPGDVGDWLSYHGAPFPPFRTGPALAPQVELETPCQKLCGGQCSIHAKRPANCRDYQVGGVACRSTVLRRRPLQASAILALLPVHLS